jgi:hypothetical protein
MSAPLISGDTLNGSRLDLIRERVANSSRDDLYALAYGDRRYLLGLVDDLTAALETLVEFTDVPDVNCSCHLNPPCVDCVEYGGIRDALERARVVLAKLSPTSPSADHPDSSLCGESSAGTGGRSSVSGAT